MQNTNVLAIFDGKGANEAQFPKFHIFGRYFSSNFDMFDTNFLLL